MVRSVLEVGVNKQRKKFICPNCLEEVPHLGEHAFVFGMSHIAEFICATNEGDYPDQPDEEN